MKRIDPAKIEAVTKAYNDLSDCFIRFSLAYTDLRSELEKTDQPTLDTEEEHIS